MSTRANWHTPDLATAEDPFAAPVEQVGTPIRLTGGEAELNLAIIELVRREAELYEAGIECEIKPRADTSCHACPLNDLGELCEIGRAQERACTRLAVETRGAQD